MKIVRLLVPLFVLGWCGTVLTGTPFIHSEGEIAVSSLDTSPDLSLQTSLEAGWKEDGWQVSGIATVMDNHWTELRWEGLATLGEISLRSSTIFDPQSASFTSTQMDVAFLWSGLQVGALTRLEGTGVGFGLSIAGPSDSIVQGINLRFNLKQYQDEIVEETFCTEFSHATINLKLPVPCMDDIFAEIDLNRDGLDEVWLQLQQPLNVLPWLSLGMAVTFRTDEKAASLSPSLSLSSPSCFDLYWGVDWESTDSTFSGLKLYGIGFHGEIGGVQIRSLTALLPDEIALVKSPYWELLGIASKIPTYCGEGEVSAVCYFGDSGLFDVGEVYLEINLPLSPAWMFSLTICLPTAGTPSFTLTWKGDL
ncbi:MAG: hypothetical protein KAI66_07615 [Lentisphaeria bacterium]|nr:hypothetical protein [Lentisphaeria bacterium]